MVPDDPDFFAAFGQQSFEGRENITVEPFDVIDVGTPSPEDGCMLSVMADAVEMKLIASKNEHIWFVLPEILEYRVRSGLVVERIVPVVNRNGLANFSLRQG